MREQEERTMEMEEAEKVVKSEEEWRSLLTPEQYWVVRQKGTERPFTGALLDQHATGTYLCVACGEELFSSAHKYDSGSGWPSFWQPIGEENVEYHQDVSLMMRRVEITCHRCGAHLGHVFEDGPKPTGLRYCVNSASLQFREAE